MAKTREQLISRDETRSRRRQRVRRRIKGAAGRPRLSVFRSNRGICAQVIDDLEGKTLVSASSQEIKESDLKKTETAGKVGELLAARAREKNIGRVVFDRGAYLYHGRVKALAEAVRKGGIEF